MHEDLRSKHLFDFDLSKPRDFSAHDLEGIIRTPYSKEPTSPLEGPSRAMAGAMKALQDKIKFLETELQSTREQLSTIESKHSIDREKWQTRFLDEIQMSKEREHLLQSRLYETEEELKKALNKLSISDEQSKIKEVQLRFAEAESKRSFDQYSVDIENLTIQIEYLQKSLQSKTSVEQKKEKVMEAAVRDKELAEEELKQQKRINSGLQSEVNYLRENADHQRSSLQKNYQTVEQELTLQNSEFSQKIKELELKNKSLRDQNHNQAQQILHLKKEIAELNRLNEANSTVKIDLIKAKSIKKPPSRPLGKTRRSVSPALKKEEANRTSKRAFESDEVFKKHISQCEREIDRLSGSYRDLIGLSSQGSGDLTNIRREMARLASDIEKKNEELYEYKKKQQDFLRERLLN